MRSTVIAVYLAYLYPYCTHRVQSLTSNLLDRSLCSPTWNVITSTLSTFATSSTRYVPCFPLFLCVFGSKRGRYIRESHFRTKWMSLVGWRTWGPSLLIRRKERITFMRTFLSSIRILTYPLANNVNISLHWLTDSAWPFFSLQFVLPEMGAQAFLFAMFLINGSWLAALLNLPLVVFNVQK